MKDRLYFKKTKLKNGIQIFTHKMDVPFARISFVIPYGSAHNPLSGTYGTAHFLEHLIFERSALYPEKNSFERFIELNGGYFNATTHPLYTEIFLEVKSELSGKALAGLVSQIYEPIFKQEDIEIQKGIILNEFKQREKYFPGRTEIAHYLCKRWRNTTRVTTRQVFGNPRDIKGISVGKIQEAHKNYFTKETKVFIGGQFDNKILKEIERIKTKKIKPKVSELKIEWIEKKKVSLKKFRDINNPILFIGGIVYNPSNEEVANIDFLGKSLVNHTHGSLSRWLRRELGWSYSLHFNWSKDVDCLRWTLEIPLSEGKQVEVVGKEIRNKIKESLEDKDFIKKELRRRLSTELFDYQKLEDRLDDAIGMMTTNGKIYTEKEQRNIMKKIANSKSLERTYKKFFSPQKTRIFVALPQK